MESKWDTEDKEKRQRKGEEIETLQDEDKGTRDRMTGSWVQGGVTSRADKQCS